MKNLSASLCAFALIAAAGSVANAQELLTNGGFETGNLTGWTLTGSTTGFGFGGRFWFQNPAQGAFQGYFGTDGPGTIISQSVAANPGDQLTVSFWFLSSVMNQEPLNNHFIATFDGATLVNMVNSGYIGYTRYSFNVTATTVNPTLSFNLRNATEFHMLDGVSVVAVPSPGAAAALGLAGVAGLRRRRR